MYQLQLIVQIFIYFYQKHIMSRPSCSLVTPTYNWPEALELLLLSVKNQTVFPDEVIVADDGSKEETRELIDRMRVDFPVPLIHIWHDDVKNRKPRIMNKAIAAAKSDYMVEIDGDIIMHPKFIEDHLAYAKKGFYLFGSRASIQKSLLPDLFSQKITKFSFFSKGITKRMRTFHMPLMMNFIKPVADRSKKLRGCNMSFWKDDFIKINGFNEGLIGWGIDDSEMIQRLHNIGIQGLRLKNVGIAFHIYHPEQSKSHIAANLEIERQTTQNKIQFIEKGVNQFL